jgi:hypothetical protein
MVGVGGFLGLGEKDVALPFAAVKAEKKNNKRNLTVDETKDSLKGAAEALPHHRNDKPRDIAFRHEILHTRRQQIAI